VSALAWMALRQARGREGAPVLRGSGSLCLEGRYLGRAGTTCAVAGVVLRAGVAIARQPALRTRGTPGR
jgi:hypothetical protein